MITLLCDRCGHAFEVDDAVAGRTDRCKRCGHELTVRSGGFRLQPIPEDEQEATGPASIDPYELAGDEPPPAVIEREDDARQGPPLEPSGPDGIPEEFLADRVPLALGEEAAPDREEGPIELAVEEPGTVATIPQQRVEPELRETGRERS